MPDFSDARTAYSNLWSKFVLICQQSGYNVLPRQNPIDLRLDDSNKNDIQMYLKKPIWLKNWPYKRMSKKKIHIIITAKELFSLNNFIIKESYVHIAYFRIKQKYARVIECIHYDFEKPCPPGDPLFHAQASCVVEGYKNLENFEYKVINELDYRFHHLRIPTAHMHLISVLTSLVADHTSYSILCQLINSIKNVDLPYAECSNLLDGIMKGKKKFISIHWY